MDLRQRFAGGAGDRQRDCFDVPALAHRDAVRERLSARCRLLSIPHLRAKLQQSGARDVREREIGIGSERAVQPCLGAGPGRQQQIDPRHVVLDGGSGGAGDRQFKTVLQQHGLPRTTHYHGGLPRIEFAWGNG